MNQFEELQDKFRVKVIKREMDTRTSIAGEPFINPGQDNHDGTTIEVDGKEVLASYAVIPVHSADHVKANNKQYLYSTPFVPSVQSAPDPAADKTFVCEVCSKECGSQIGLASHMRTHNQE